MTLTFPIGSSVYFILVVIDLFSFPPISGADNSDFVFSVSKPDGHNSARNPAKTIESLFALAMLKILQDDTLMIQESKLCQGKRNSMFFLIKRVFIGIPIKIRSFVHRIIIYSDRNNVNI